jgi:hypothetical protein
MYYFTTVGRSNLGRFGFGQLVKTQGLYYGTCGARLCEQKLTCKTSGDTFSFLNIVAWKCSVFVLKKAQWIREQGHLTVSRREDGDATCTNL